MANRTPTNSKGKPSGHIKGATPTSAASSVQPSTPVQTVTTGQPSTRPKQPPPPQPANSAKSSTSNHTPAPEQPASPSLDILNTLQGDISTLSQEGKVIVNTIVKALQTLLDMKEQKIRDLESRVNELENKTIDLENQIDDCNQYERRDTLIISGPSLPNETPNENTSEVVVNMVKQTLKINIDHTDINIAHRLGNKLGKNSNKPIIVKLHSRQKKEDIVSACITLKPDLYINESLTPKRLALLKTIRGIRRVHLDLFQQCYTKDGRIYIKLRCSNQKHVVTNEQSLCNFLDKFPVLRESL